MNQDEFQKIYYQLGDKCRQVLQLKLAGKSNKEIADKLEIKSEATVRKHLEIAYKKFAIASEDKRGSWADLQRLFTQFIPELIPPIPSYSQPKWVGRSWEINTLQRWKNESYQIIMLVGEGGVGKTTLAERFISVCDFHQRLDIKIALEIANLERAEKVVQTWLQRDFHEDVPRDFYLSLKLLSEKLIQSKILIFIDNLETLLVNGVFLPDYRDYLELFRVLSDPRNRGLTLITSREYLKEAQIKDIQTLGLSGLSLGNWQEYFGQNLSSEDIIYLEKFHKTYNGNAYAMKLLYSEIHHQYNGEINTFYQQNRYDIQNLEPFSSLIDNQLDRLNQHSPAAYRLICRLAACRYQQIEWLPDSCVKSLLWDIEHEQRGKIARRLFDCSLVQFHRGEYRMHPGICAAGLTRLQQSDDWEQTHRTIGEFWYQSHPQIQSSRQGLEVLEAYHHYVKIQDYDAAWDVLRRPAISDLPEELFLYFLSWGFIREVKQLAEELIGKISPIKEASLLRCLGDCHAYLLENGIDTALEYHRQAQISAQKSGDIWTEFNSYSDMGLCYYIAGEYEQGLNTYKSKLKIAQSPVSGIIQARENSCWCEIALLNSCLGNIFATKHAITSLGDYTDHPLDFVPPWQVCWDLNMLALAQRNTGNYTDALANLEQVMVLAEQFNFNCDRARCWSTKGDVYRLMQDFPQSLKYQQLAIAFFGKIGNSYELGESQYYLGQLYLAMGNLEQARECWQKSLQLFQKMQLSRQVAKVLTTLDGIS
ncbi:tetratricopeptide repeat protein [Calothrix sp. NIES-3974]|uniref:tetratricopeptide repeat protein n=1 Tax=Calothrix sp. NIES-3974 TaxID=2005462 RepID=UPI000B5F0269|nr:tetratricopeptide repeat protein [Calothrix sp. NIES-3974]BAZ03974.1 hypothetical protein NIES3974_06040 [Calothrix sp. NIES-3974]